MHPYADMCLHNMPHELYVSICASMSASFHSRVHLTRAAIATWRSYPRAYVCDSLEAVLPDKDGPCTYCACSCLLRLHVLLGVIQCCSVERQSMSWYGSQADSEACSGEVSLHPATLT